MQSEQIDLLAKALSQAQSGLRGAEKNAENPFFKSDYADLTSMWEACRLSLTSNGLSVCQTTEIWNSDSGDSQKLFLVTTLLHSSGQWISGRYPIITPKMEPQAIGAALTYARRYALAAIVGISQKDDDAESVTDRTVKQQPARPGAKSQSVASILPAIFSNQADPNLSNFVVSFGKYKGKKLSEISIPDLQSYIEYLCRTANEKNETLSKNGTDFISKAEAYIESFEKKHSNSDLLAVSPLPSGPPPPIEFPPDDEIPF